MDLVYALGEGWVVHGGWNLRGRKSMKIVVIRLSEGE